MMNALISIGLGIVIFALIVGVGVVVLTNFGNSVAVCATDYSYNDSTRVCQEDANLSNTADPANTGWTTNNTLIGYLSTNLVTWVPAIIALGVGLLFIGALMNQQGSKY